MRWHEERDSAALLTKELLMPVRNSLTLIIAAVVSLACYEKATRNRFASTFALAMDIVEDNYVEEVKPRELFENAMRGMVNQLDDYSDYYGPDFYRQFQQSIDQEFIGIGITVEGPPDVEQLTVVSPVYGSPAYRAGLRAGDLILEIDGTSTAGMLLSDAIKRMQGKPNTQVELLVRHVGPEEPVRLRITRELIRTKSVLGETLRKDGNWDYSLQDDPDIGYVRMTTFGEHSVDELREVLSFKDRPVNALILDLRGNVGGLLDAAVDICDMFIDEGVIVSIRGRDGESQAVFEADKKSTVFDRAIPMAVLVDRYSASASEIVAACLKDHQRAVVVGQRTWGKGTVQNVIPLEHGSSALKLTTATYWRPNGQNIHRMRTATESDNWGVRPDEGLEVALTDDEYRRVYEQRRARDVVADQPQPAPDTTQDSPAVPDRQLLKAVETMRTKKRNAAGPDGAKNGDSRVAAGSRA